MSKDKPKDISDQGARRSHSDTSRRNREIASYYTEEMSKEAVGGLFSDKDEGEDEGDFEELEEPVSKTSKRSKPPEAVSSSKDGEDSEYVDYLNSYSREKKARKGVTEKEQKALNQPASATRRTTSVTLGTSSSSRPTATLRHSTGKQDHDFEEDDYDTGRMNTRKTGFSETIFANVRVMALICGILVLIIFISLILNVNGANAKLTTLQKNYDTMETQVKDTNALKIEISKLEAEVEKLETENTKLKTSSSSATTNSNGANTTPNQNGAQTPSSSAAPATQAPSSTTTDTYTVVSGDSYWSVAQKTLGNGSRYKEILELNGLAESTPLKVGAVLKIPR